MKKVIVFFYRVDSREAVEFIVNDLRQAFDDLVDFPVIYLDDFSWEESLQADAYLIPLESWATAPEAPRKKNFALSCKTREKIVWLYWRMARRE